MCDLLDIGAAIEIDGNDLAIDLAGFEKGDGLLRGRNVIIGLARDRARGIGRTEHGGDLFLVHAGLYGVDVNVDEDMSVPVDLRAAGGKQARAEQKRGERRTRSRNRRAVST